MCQIKKLKGRNRVDKRHSRFFELVISFIPPLYTGRLLFETKYIYPVLLFYTMFTEINDKSTVQFFIVHPVHATENSEFYRMTLC